MWPFVFLAGFVAGTLVTFLVGVIVDRVFTGFRSRSDEVDRRV